MYTVQEIFNNSMDFMNKKTIAGTVDANSTSFYKARALGIMNSWQEEMSIELGLDIPITLTTFEDNMTVNFKSCASNFLAGNLLLQENTTEADFFIQRYEELKAIIIKKNRVATIALITDVNQIMWSE